MKKIKILIMTIFLTGFNIINVMAKGIDVAGIRSDVNEDITELNNLFPILYLLYGFSAFIVLGKVGIEVISTLQQEQSQAHEAAKDKMLNLVKLIILIPIIFIVIVQLINWRFGTNLKIILK